jgi:hypothetical protein
MKRFVMDIPVDMHKRFKAVCVMEEKTMKQVVQQLMEEYLEKAEKRLKPKK